jgi:hypothetical protein
MLGFPVAVRAGFCRNARRTAFPGRGCRRNHSVRAALCAHVVLPFTRGYLTRLIIKGAARKLGPLPLEIELQRCDSGCDVRFGKLQLTTFMTVFRMLVQLSGSLLRFLFPT